MVKVNGGQKSAVGVDYAVEKYAERLPISNELLEDNAAGLLAYAAAWFAPKYILTKNSLLLAFLEGLALRALYRGAKSSTPAHFFT